MGQSKGVPLRLLINRRRRNQQKGGDFLGREKDKKREEKFFWREEGSKLQKRREKRKKKETKGWQNFGEGTEDECERGGGGRTENRGESLFLRGVKLGQNRRKKEEDFKDR
jgi:hypothetical protein